MAEYIEREAAKKEFSLNFGGVSHAVIAARLLDSIPTADVAPVVHAKWIDDVDEEGKLRNAWRKCSSCGCLNYSKKPNYCPNCGARMDGE